MTAVKAVAGGLGVKNLRTEEWQKYTPHEAETSRGNMPSFLAKMSSIFADPAIKDGESIPWAEIGERLKTDTGDQ